MRQVRQEKLDVVVRQFEQQLLKEAELEEKRNTEALRDVYESRVGQVEAEKEAQCSDIDKMVKQIEEQMAFLKVVRGELEAKKGEI